MQSKSIWMLLLGLAGLSLTLAIAAREAGPPPFERIAVTGKAGPGLAPIDLAVLRMMDRHGVPGAALAIAKNGKLVLAKGYGWGCIEPARPTTVDDPFGIASLSKTLTATAILRLVEDGKLRLDDRAFDLLNNLQPPRGTQIDPRIKTITVRQLLYHSGGWNRNVNGDPVNWSKQIAFRLGVPQPLTAEQFMSFMLGQPLDFDPGTDNQYSNVGYIALGLIVARASGQPYEQFVRERVLKPAGMRVAGLHRPDGRYLPSEALRYLAGTEQALPPLQMPMVDAAGGWSASALDIIRFLTALDGSRVKPLLSDRAFSFMLETPPKPLKVRANGTYTGLGWDSVIRNDKGFGYFKDGSYHGMRTFMKRLPSGINWVLLFNASMQPDSVDTSLISEAMREVREAVEQANHPDIDLFKEFP